MNDYINKLIKEWLEEHNHDPELFDIESLADDIKRWFKE